MTERLDKVIFVGFLALIIFTVAAFGTVEPWSIAVFEFFITILLFLWAVKGFVAKGLDIKLPITFWPVAAFFVYGLFQAFTVSIDVETTRFTVRILFFLVTAHLLAANFLACEKRLSVITKFLTILGFLLAVFGLVQYFTSNDAIFWFRRAATGVWVHGPFVNHNHFAGYMELLVPIPIALIFTRAVKESRVIYGFAAVVMIVASILAVSRGGIISMSIALVFVTVCAYNFSRSRIHSGRVYSGLMITEGESKRRPKFRQLASAAVIGISILAGLIWLGIEPLVNRLPDNNVVSVGENVETFETSRGWIWKTAFTIFKANPVFGTGMGTFDTAVTIHATGNKASNDGKTMVWDRAHNDYLQILSDTGLIGAAISVWFLVTLFIVIFKNFHLKDRFHTGLGLGFAGSALSLLVHSVFDFNLQLPATSLLFLTIIAISSGLNPKAVTEQSGLIRRDNDVTINEIT